VDIMAGGQGAAPKDLGVGSGRRRSLVREPEVAELRAFCSAAAHGSIAAAAREIGVSQPALSKRLRALEVVVGSHLFERSTRGVKLTPEGVHLYGAARRLLRSADAVQTLVTSPTLDRHVRVAASSVAAELRLPGALMSLALLEPALSVEVVAASSSFVRELVAEARCSLGIAAVDPDMPPGTALREKVIWRDEVVIGVPPGHRWLAREEIPPEEFAATALVQPEPSSTTSRLVASALELAGLERVPPAAALGSPRAIVEVATASGQPGLVSAMAAREGAVGQLEIRRVRGFRFDREFALVWRGTVDALELPAQILANHLLDLPFARSRRLGREAWADLPPNVVG
jgi:DNA-binding transcriptional LysR family regulator